MCLPAGTSAAPLTACVYLSKRECGQELMCAKSLLFSATLQTVCSQGFNTTGHVNKVKCPVFYDAFS